MKNVIKFFERLDEDIQFCIGLAGVQVFAVVVFVIMTKQLDYTTKQPNNLKP